MLTANLPMGQSCPHYDKEQSETCLQTLDELSGLFLINFDEIKSQTTEKHPNPEDSG